jgi:hypothetical protein
VHSFLISGNQYPTGHPAGQCWKLPAFIDQQDLTTEYYHLSASQKEKLRHHVHNLHKNCIKFMHFNSKELPKQVSAIFDSMQQEVHTSKMYLASIN